jgi:hypothetical protein
MQKCWKHPKQKMIITMHTSRAHIFSRTFAWLAWSRCSRQSTTKGNNCLKTLVFLSLSFSLAIFWSLITNSLRYVTNSKKPSQFGMRPERDLYDGLQRHSLIDTEKMTTRKLKIMQKEVMKKLKIWRVYSLPIFEHWRSRRRQVPLP